ncbi:MULTISPECIES: ABC transporter permease [Fusobacterium]|uniref:ABC transporter permease n=1 Tax=Fusobacterium TaxID=848 RepID=UPI0025C21548|nr:ABC transporter permease [Fusobacterium sp.]MCI5725063.1 ABC transporter permease [Fusobacterium sp.]MCI7222836.1 ABC transporter permease [Fusobacterium sp.]MDY5305778.1 ABC transporter permease [Fusobacterium gastrosuis]
MIEFFIAKKQMLERKKQSLVSILGVLIGITVLTVSIGISNGLDKNMINSILSLSSHVTVQSADSFENYKEFSEKIEKIENVKGVIPTVEAQGLIKYKNLFNEHISGVKIVGYDLEKAINSMDLKDKIVYGNIDLENKKGILVGKELAVSTGMNIGDKLKLVTAENSEFEMEIMGIFESGFYDYDLNMVLIPLVTAQYINYKGDSVDRLTIRLDDPYKADLVKSKIPDDDFLYTYTWGEQNKALLSALTLEKTIMIIVFSLIVVIAGFLIWITLNTLVREKTKDIGILRSMGFSKKNIMNIFLIQGLVLGGIGIIIGIILSIVLLWYIKNYTMNFISTIYYIKNIPIEISIKEILTVVAANSIIILISSIFPAYRAAKLENVEALRHE